MKKSYVALAVILSIIGGYIGAMGYSKLYPQGGVAPVSHKETAYERVMRTNTLRCGYVLYGPIVQKDPNTGEFSGIVVDLMNEIGNLLKIKIEWAEEVGWATTVEGLKTGRYDAICAGFWRQSVEAKHVFYTEPFSYSMVGALIRPDDFRFDNRLDLINDPNVKIVSSDGALASAIARRDFPKAQLLEYANLTDPGQLMEDVVSRKGDIIFVDSATMEQYLKSNPGRLRRLPGPPLRMFQNTLALPQDDIKLKSLLDTVIIELRDNGGMDRILDKYDPEHKQFLRIPKPYEVVR